MIRRQPARDQWHTGCKAPRVDVNMMGERDAPKGLDAGVGRPWSVEPGRHDACSSGGGPRLQCVGPALLRGGQKALHR